MQKSALSRFLTWRSAASQTSSKSPAPSDSVVPQLIKLSILCLRQKNRSSVFQVQNINAWLSVAARKKSEKFSNFHLLASATVRDYGSCLSFTVMLTAGVACLRHCWVQLWGRALLSLGARGVRPKLCALRSISNVLSLENRLTEKKIQNPASRWSEDSLGKHRKPH